MTAPGRLSIESQANYARGLAFDLFPADDRAVAAARLAELIAAAGGHLGTGFLSTGQLLPALADHGQADVAFATLLSTGVPSWLGMLEHGATTAWEWWDAVGDDGAVRGSLNHYSKAAVVSFLYTHVAGIRLDAVPDASTAAYRRVRVAPVLGGGLTWARASIETRPRPDPLRVARREQHVLARGRHPRRYPRVHHPARWHDARVGHGIHSFTCSAP